MRRLAAVAAMAAALAGCRREPPLPVYGQVAEFQLVGRDGRAFASAALAGKTWVADFIFTRCAGPCPMMTQKMRRVEDAVGRYRDVRLVSFTVDPEYDRPAVLDAYARRFRAKADRWFFLTGETATLDRLARRDFKLSSVDGSFVHSTRFALVDPAGRIRGYYSSEEPGEVERLLADIGKLERERGRA